ncbi:hypothetical protein [Methylobacterium gnaphalii]|nr:hypothetical protein [Methylobacterium gnaphalii]GLS48933.1 hypothetical protein GCM10007885_17800 [Methylobacterium gnaphalii]
MTDDEKGDLLSGYEDIGKHLRQTPRQAKHLAEIGASPIFKLPGSSIVRARRSTLDAWLADREAAARRPADA